MMRKPIATLAPFCLTILAATALLLLRPADAQFPPNGGGFGVPNTSTPTSSGSWTPVDASGATLTFTGVTGKYTVIGNIVFYSAILTYPSTASGASAFIGGLPFTSANDALYTAGAAQITGVAATGVIVAPNSKAMLVYNGATGATLTNTNLGTATVRISGFYPLT